MVEHHKCPHCGQVILPFHPSRPKPRKTGTYNHFPAFWEEYPRKASEKGAKRAWKKRHCDRKYKVIMEALAKQKDDGMFILVDKMRGCPLASTWLMARRWQEDDKWKSIVNE